MDAVAALVDEGTGLRRITAGEFPSNCYVVPLNAGRCAVIDPGLDGPAIEAALAQLELAPAAVLCTHGHFDHAGSAALLQRRHGCPVYLPAADLQTLRSSNFLLMAFRLKTRIELPEVTPVDPALAADVQVESEAFTFHAAPGHTPGSCVIQFGDNLFTGDTLYANGVGLSKLPGEVPAQLRRTLRALFARFPGHALAHPGHGGSASLASIAQNNAALQRFLAAADEPERQT
jgi:glyoxylase-like metal-dependent hydrolase (beta-lactamase superfamily II)